MAADSAHHEAEKPLLRGWLHAVTAVVAVAFTVVVCWRARHDPSRMVSLLVFGLSAIELYTVSALYHIGHWSAEVRRLLHALDHANIFVQIAGTYTPLCYIMLSGPPRPLMLVTIWALAVAGVTMAAVNPRTHRGLRVALYIAMGWVALIAAPWFWNALPPLASAGLVLGGLLYTVGAVVYACRWPNPFPRIFGFHEVFHLFVVAGGSTFATVVWVWALPFPRA